MSGRASKIVEVRQKRGEWYKRIFIADIGGATPILCVERGEEIAYEKGIRFQVCAWDEMREIDYTVPLKPWTIDMYKCGMILQGKGCGAQMLVHTINRCESVIKIGCGDGWIGPNALSSEYELLNDDGSITPLIIEPLE
jgi:hypothetical protein